jgi:hypothetical protein
MAKAKTNDQMLKALLKDLSGFDTALLRERICFAFKLTMQSIEETPEAWGRSVVHPRAYIELNKKIQEHIGLEN